MSTDGVGHLSATGVGSLTLGRDLTVRRMGFGAMRLTGRGVWGDPPDRETAKAVLRRAVELGVNLIDTADSYGPEVSEELIGEALHPYPEDLVIATKAGMLRDGPGQWRPDGRPEHLKQACEGSLRRLRLERIHLYQLHRVDPAVPLEESVGALAELRSTGKVAHIGLSNVSVDELARGRAVAEIVAVQNRYNLSDRASEDVVKVCEADGIGFLPWFPLATGNLAQGDDRIAQVAKAHNATPAQVALAWLLARSPVMLPIPGTSSVDHLEENVAAATITLTSDDMAVLGQ